MSFHLTPLSSLINAELPYKVACRSVLLMALGFTLHVPGYAASGPLVFGSDTAFDSNRLKTTDPLWQEPDFELVQPAIDPALIVRSKDTDKTFLTRKELKAANIHKKIPAGCRGVWYTPIPASTVKSDPANQITYINAGEAYYRQQGSAYFKDNVLIKQPDRSIEAEELALDSTGTVADARGNLRLNEPGLTLFGDHGIYNLQDETGIIDNATYITEETQAHGHAVQIQRLTPMVTVLTDTDYSTCEPQSRVWHLSANKLTLNQEKNVGHAEQARLFIKDQQVLKIPNFTFPLESGRISGFLSPKFAYRNDSGFDLSVPYYLNLAPNYDATLIPRILYRRGFMLEGEYRYMSRLLGLGTVQGAYMQKDKLNSDNDRYWIRYKADAPVGQHIITHINLNSVSDKDFFTDFGNYFITNISPYQERSIAFDFINTVPGLSAQLKAQSYHTIDPTLKDISRPYERLPQLLLDYKARVNYDWILTNNNDFGYFVRRISDNSGPDSSGYRIYNNVNFVKQFDFRPGYIKPELAVRHLTIVGDQTSQTTGNQVSQTIVVPQLSLNSGLIFERQGKFGQTLEPRFTYVYAPYKDQSTLPNFDTTAINANFDQLFNPYRFAGHDRIEDNNFYTFALTHRLYDETGNERSTVSVGERFYQSNRRVMLPLPVDPTTNLPTPANVIRAKEAATTKKSGVAIQGTIRITPRLRFDGSTALTSTNSFSNTVAQLNYIGPSGFFAQAGYVKRKIDPYYDQTASQQLVTGLIQPIADRWRIFLYDQYDLGYNISREEMVGIDYDSCCWRFSIYHRKFYNNLDDPKEVKSKKALVAEVSLKGLGTASRSMGNLLRERLNGYIDAENVWKERQ